MWPGQVEAVQVEGQRRTWEPVGSHYSGPGGMEGEPWWRLKYISKVELTGLDVGWREGEEAREIAQDLV